MDSGIATSQVSSAEAAAAPQPGAAPAAPQAVGPAAAPGAAAAPAGAAEGELVPSRRERLTILTCAHGAVHIRGAVLPLIYPTLMAAMGFGYVDLGAMLTVTRLIGGLLQGIWGRVSRVVPAKWLLTFEQLGMALGIGLVGASHNYVELTGAVTFGQVAASPHHPLASSMLSRWYGKARGAALSVHFAGANVGTLLSPLIATFLLVRWGWQDTLYVFTIPCVLCAALVALRLPLENGSGAASHGRARGAPAATGTPAAGERAASASGGGFLDPLRDRLVRRLILTASVTAGGKGLGILQTLVPLLLIRGLHMSTVPAGLIFTAFTASSVAGPLLTGRLSDRFARPRFLSVLLAISAVAGIGLAFGQHTSLWVLVPLLAFFGLTVYGCSPVEQAIVGDLTSGALSEDAYSLFYGLTFGASAIWPLALTFVLSRWGFTATLLVIAATYVTGMIIYGTQDWSVPSKAGAGA